MAHALARRAIALAEVARILPENYRIEEFAEEVARRYGKRYAAAFTDRSAEKLLKAEMGSGALEFCASEVPLASRFGN
ncbi:MAG: hypothetical protein LAP21_12840 [Acidobacteriia bacterium]|nr:hypothetical protein [Terriglobia bacterium]